MPKSKAFKHLIKGVEKYYTGKPVPMKYRPKYGVRYSRMEAKQVAYAIAKSRGMKV